MEPAATDIPPPGTRRARLHQIVFSDDTIAGRLFDILLIGSIVASVLVVSISTMQGLSATVRHLLHVIEWFFTALFTVEYIIRLFAVRRPQVYLFSFFGIVDLFAILPTWLSIFIPGTQALLVVRVLRLLRIFRILKLARFSTEASALGSALRASTRKIIVFLVSVATIVVIVGALMFVLEGAENGFTSIPKSMYWAVVTLTTVGYGDIAPRTPLGQILASLVMILGYSIIAVPTGIVSSEIALGAVKRNAPPRTCVNCASAAHDTDARYCKQCGERL